MRIKAIPSMLIAVCLFGGCAVQHAYPGPEQPESELSRIYFDAEYYAPGQGISLSQMKVNDVEIGMFEAGAFALPGEEQVSFRFSLASKDCDLTTDDSYCTTLIRNGSCHVTFTAQKGESYRIEVRGALDGVAVFVIEEKSHGLVTSTSCSA